MKKLFIIMAAFCIAASANAQVGIIAGVSTPGNDIQKAYDNYSAIDQYHAGLTIKIPLVLGFAVQPSVIYDVKGATIEQYQTAGVKSETFSKTGCIEVPVQLQWGIGIAGLARVYGFVEPYIAYGVNMEKLSNFSVDLGAIDINKNTDWEKVELNNEVFDKTRLMYGAGAGAGVEVLNKVQLSARYVWNMGYLFNEEGELNFTSVDDTVNTMKSTNSNGIMVSLAFLF